MALITEMLFGRRKYIMNGEWGFVMAGVLSGTEYMIRLSSSDRYGGWSLTFSQYPFSMHGGNGRTIP